MRDMSQRGERAWILPTTLLGITLILGTIRLLSLDGTGVSRLYSDIRLSHGLRQHAMREILSRGAPKPGCEQRAITLDETTIPYEVCGERRVPLMVSPSSGELPLGRIDYDAIFSQAIPCPSTPTKTKNPHGERLTASKDCPLPPLLEGGIITLENLLGETTRVLARASHASVIASPGGITVTGALTLESDLILIAGGDIAIGAITASSRQTRKVTLISALGAIRVGSISTGISVVAGGRSTIEVPETPQSPPFPLPPQREYDIVGIRAVAE